MITSFTFSSNVMMNGNTEDPQHLNLNDLLVEQVKDYAIFLMDPDGRVVRWGTGAERIFGYQEDEILSQSAFCIFTPEDIEHGEPEKELRTAEVEGRAEDERWHVHKDGTRFYASGIVTALRSEAGKLRGFVKVARDFTERKQAEAAMRESEERFRLLMEGVKEYAIFMLDPDGYVISWNTGAKRLLGYEEGEIIGQSASRFFTPEDNECGLAQQEFQKAMAGGQAEDERWHVHKDGTRFWSSDVVTALWSETGKLRGFVKVMRDFTERKQAEEERAQLLEHEQAARAKAEEANRLKDEFLATVSHELRTPLNAMLGWARLLRTRKLNEAVTGRALETIERNAQLQTQLIEDLLDLSRIVRGQLRLNLHPIELVPVIEAAIDAARPAAEAKAIEIAHVLDSSASLALGDPNRLQQVVWNLLSNATKFTPPGGRIEVILQQLDSHAQIRISDTGIGITPGFLPYVFDRFRQSDGTSTRFHNGLGLGLAIVRQLVELHGGTVHAASRGEGQGATFTVKLPLVGVYNLAHPLGMGVAVAQKGSDDVASDLSMVPSGSMASTIVSRYSPPVGHPTSEGTVAAEPSILAGLRVLVVEDEADAREIMTIVLEQCGAEVTAATSVGEALEVLQRLRPNVLVSDIGMVGEDGYTLIRKVRALKPEQGGQIAATALTAYAGEEDRVSALTAGFQVHLAKPVNPGELVATVANLAQLAGKD